MFVRYQFKSFSHKMSAHPIQPSAKVLEVSLNKDIEEWNAILDRENNLDKKIAENSENSEALLENMQKCDNDNQPDLTGCPKVSFVTLRSLFKLVSSRLFDGFRLT